MKNLSTAACVTFAALAGCVRLKASTDVTQGDAGSTEIRGQGDAGLTETIGHGDAGSSMAHADASIADARDADATDGGGVGDATVDSRTAGSGEVLCEMGSPLLVADLSTYDAGSAQFGSGVWLARTTTPGQILIFTQLPSVPSGFITYQVDFDAGAVAAVLAGLEAGGGAIQLLDVEANPGDAGWAALAMTSTDVDAATLQLLDLPSTISDDGGFDTPAYPVSQPGSWSSGEIPAVAAFVQDGLANVWWAGPASFVPGPSLPDLMLVGRGVLNAPGNPIDVRGAIQVQGVTPPGSYNFNSPPLMHLGSDVVVLGGDVNGLPTAVLVPDDLGDAGTSTPLPPLADAGLYVSLVAAKASAADPSQGLVWAYLMGGGARVETLTIASGAGPGPWDDAAATLPWSDIPTPWGSSGYTPIGQAFDGDELVLVGSPYADSGTTASSGLVLLWLGPHGAVVAHAGTSGALLPYGQVAATAVQFADRVGETSATFDVAWIEDPFPGVLAQRLVAAVVICQAGGVDAAIPSPPPAPGTPPPGLSFPPPAVGTDDEAAGEDADAGPSDAPADACSFAAERYSGLADGGFGVGPLEDGGTFGACFATVTCSGQIYTVDCNACSASSCSSCSCSVGGTSWNVIDAAPSCDWNRQCGVP